MNKPASFVPCQGSRFYKQSYRKLSGQAHYSVYKTYNLILGFYLNKGTFDKFDKWQNLTLGNHTILHLAKSIATSFIFAPQ